MSIVLGSHTIKAFVVSPEKYKVLGIVRIGMEFGLLSTTECGSYVRVNGSTVTALDRAQVEQALRLACRDGRGESFATSRSGAAPAAPSVVLRKHRHAQATRCSAGTGAVRRLEMDAQQTLLLRESSAMVPWQSDLLSGSFYRHLLLVDPTVQTAYAGNKINPVSAMLVSMGSAIAMLDDPETLTDMLIHASQRHAAYGALPVHFPALGEALLLTLAGALGDKFTPDTRQAWTEFYQRMSNCMTQPAPLADSGLPHGPFPASTRTVIHQRKVDTADNRH